MSGLHIVKDQGPPSIQDLGELLADQDEDPECSPTEWVDTETGEVVELPEGDDALSYAAHQLATTKAQAKRWDELVGVWSRFLLSRQAEKSAAYGDIKATIRADTYPSFRADDWCDDADTFEMVAADWRALATNAKGFNTADMPTHLKELVGEYVETKHKRPWVAVATVARLAPGKSTRTPAKEEAEE